MYYATMTNGDDYYVSSLDDLKRKILYSAIERVFELQVIESIDLEVIVAKNAVPAYEAVSKEIINAMNEGLREDYEAAIDPAWNRPDAQFYVTGDMVV